MDIFDNHSDYNRFMVANGVSVNNTSCSEYILLKSITRRLNISEITDSIHNHKISLFVNRLENGRFEFLQEVNDLINEGMNLFDIIEYYDSIKYKEVAKRLMVVINKNAPKEGFDEWVKSLIDDFFNKTGLLYTTGKKFSSVENTEKAIEYLYPDFYNAFTVR